MKIIKSSFIFLIYASLFISCNLDSDVRDTLGRVNSIIEEQPDSALFILQSIDNQDISTRKAKAEYSLLMSMALDKNYIDTTDFSILQPAIDYYSRHGNPTEKLRTYYYQGRIYGNQGDIAYAIMSLKRALEEGEESDEVLTKARAHVALGESYRLMYHYKDYINENIQAAEYYKTSKEWSNNYYNSLFRIISGANIIEDYDLSHKYIEECKAHLDTFDSTQLQSFYSSYLSYDFLHNNSIEEIKGIYEIYTKNIPEECRNPLNDAFLLLQIGKYDSALSVISTIDPYVISDSEKLKYYALLSSIYYNMNLHKEGWKAEKEYGYIVDSLTIDIYHQDIQFIEEQHKNEIKHLQETKVKEKIIFSIVLGIIILLGILLYIRGNLKRKTIEKSLLEQELQRYKLQYQQIVYEKDNLAELLTHNKSLSKETENALNSRLSLLNKFLKSYIINNSEVNSQLDKEMTALIDDREAFMESTRLSFAGSNPEFIEYLELKGLTQWEISYCCLYALGLKGKDIGTYINLPSHYNHSHIIRTKLGINEHDTNLGIYIQQLMKQYS